jgi:hypothetical protein
MESRKSFGIMQMLLSQPRGVAVVVEIEAKDPQYSRARLLGAQSRSGLRATDSRN